MKAIYEPRGQAREYAPLAINLYQGCAHGCKYCYAPACMKKSREQWTSEQTVRKNILDLLQKDLIEMVKTKDNRQVLMCFITDPYQRDYEFNYITKKAIELFRAYDKRFIILTKGGMKAARDFYLYKKGDEFASTLTFISPEKSIEIEPGAALPEDRIKAIKYAKRFGIRTWVSLEPVIEPEETFKIIDETHKYVDLFKIGKVNYFNGADKSIDWKEFTLNAVEKFKSLNKEYLIKDSLKKYL